MSAEASGNRTTNDEFLQQVDDDLTVEVTKALEFLREQGFAVAAFTPTELRGADPDHIEDAMVQMGWDAIDMNATEPLPEEEGEEKVPQETTLTKFQGIRAGNYSTMPTIDVPILPDVHVCNTCAEPIVRVLDPKSVFGGRWEHVRADAPEHWVTTATRCRYCNSHDAKYLQHAWYDAVECDRCGGVSGNAIGD
jgi:hypothetical protein